MMLRKCNSMWPVVYLVLGVVTSVFAGKPTQEFSRTILREFSTTPDGMTVVYNKYGKININTWQNKSVKIDITIIVNANDQRGADRVFDQIKVNFANTAGYVKAETFVGEINKSWWTLPTALQAPAYQDFKINYEVWMPVGNQLELKNKYGNSFIAPLNGKLYAEIRYGDLRAEALNGDATISVDNGKVTIARAKNLNGQAAFSTVNVADVKDVQLDTRNSEIKLEKAAYARITSRYDNFILGNIDDLRLQTKFADVYAQSARTVLLTAQYTDFSFAKLAHQIDADLIDGALNIQSVSRGFSDINLVARKTNVQINLEQGSSSRFTLEGANCDVTLPQKSKTIKTSRDGAQFFMQGFVIDSNAKGIVKARLTEGTFTLR